MWWIILAFLLLRKQAPRPANDLLPPTPLPPTSAPQEGVSQMGAVFHGSISGIAPIINVDGAQKLMQPDPALGFGRYNY